MSLDLADFETRMREAVMLFWSSRSAAAARQAEMGRQDTGTRGAVTAGKNMDGFLELVHALTQANGLAAADVCFQRQLLTLPGFFRPKKLWDMLILRNGQLVAALEFKSQVGPSFGNNFNNRSEEAIGIAHDLWTAYREGAFGKEAPRPFLGWIMLLEECTATQTPIQNLEPHFSVLPEFANASYAERYNTLCSKLVQEGPYASSTLLLSPRTADRDGTYRHLSELTSPRMFATQFASHIAAASAR